MVTVNWKYIVIVVGLVMFCSGKHLLNAKTLEEVNLNKTYQSSSMDLPNYEVVPGTPLEFFVDLNGDGKGEVIRVYRELTDTRERRLPIMVKIFSGERDSLKEEFSYKTGFGHSGLRCNEVALAKVMDNFWGDGRKVVMVQGVSTGYGSGSTQQLYFFTYQNGKYVVVEGPQYGWSQGAPSGYIFAGEKAKGTKIILASPTWDRKGDVYLGSHHYQFTIYDWDGNKYIGTGGGITKNIYGWHWWEKDDRDFIEQIIQTEPQVLKSSKEGSFR